MIREVKLKKMDKTELRKVDGGSAPDCNGCNNCGTKSTSLAHLATYTNE